MSRPSALTGNAEPDFDVAEVARLREVIRRHFAGQKEKPYAQKWLMFPSGLGERTALFTRFRRACSGSERTSDGYIELPIMPPFPRESPEAIRRGNGGEWRAASLGKRCHLYRFDRDKPAGSLHR